MILYTKAVINIGGSVHQQEENGPHRSHGKPVVIIKTFVQSYDNITTLISPESKKSPF